MNNYKELTRQNYLLKRQMLSSLILNPPYKIDSYTTSPKISKLFFLPFGIKVETKSLTTYCFKLVISLVCILTTTTLLITFINLPIQNQNNKLINNSQSLINKKLTNIVNIQETATYKNLFLNANRLSLKEPQEIIYLNPPKEETSYTSNKIIVLNKYPSLQFSGF